MKQTLNIVFTIVMLFAVSTATARKMDQQLNRQPLNVLLITSDDLGKQLSCYGDNTIQTPNIDRLAKGGMMFRNAFVTQASCSSSRSSILTGLYPHTNGQVGLAHLGFEMNGEYPNLSTILKENGYFSGIIGKLHVEPHSQFVFDYERIFYNEARDIKLVASRADTLISLAGDKPFFMYLNYTDPHVPFYRQYEGFPTREVYPEDVKAFDFQGIDNPEQLQRISDFYCCIRRLDEGIGLLQKVLEKHGVLDNTLVIFLGDHGAPFARGKAACYESSVNIPFVVSCPGYIESGTESSALVSSVDILPTILETLGIKIPEGVQGKSLIPVLKQEKDKVRDHLFTEFNYHCNRLDNFYPRRAVRTDRYKLILNLPSSQIENGITNIDGDKAFDFSQTEKYNGTWVREAFNRLKEPPKVELFDLSNDPYEKNNLAENQAYQDVKNDLLLKLNAWMEETNDPYFEPENVKKEIEVLNAR